MAISYVGSNRRRALWVLVALASSLPLAGWVDATFAQSAPPKDMQDKARAVILAQMDAFEQEDALKAFSYASVSIRRKLGSPDAFMDMVKEGYPIIYRHQSLHFLKGSWKEGAFYQEIQLSDEEGRVWVAQYRLILQPDGELRVDGCSVRATEGRMI